MPWESGTPAVIAGADADSGNRIRSSKAPAEDRLLELEDITALGYRSDAAARILSLLSEVELLNQYLLTARAEGCTPLTRISRGYPAVLRQRLGEQCPSVLWAKGDIAILERPRVALVGSRDIREENLAFAQAVGREAARQGYVLVSGNARGSDSIAQRACLQAGGYVISVVADVLARQRKQERVLYLSEEDMDASFSVQRALSRNRVIHALAEKTFVAQSECGVGGTWSGTVKNLRSGWSPVFCYQDGSEGVSRLEQIGAQCIKTEDLKDFALLKSQYTSLFDQG